MRPTLFGAAMLAIFGLPAAAATISFVAPASANGTFDVVVRATNVFSGRDPSTDGIISYGFDLALSNPLLVTLTGVTSGPLFDPATTEPGTDVFGAASGLGIFAPVSEPLTLATLHFKRTAAGTIAITISSDPASFFQGLQFLNAPFAESIGGKVTIADAAATPEPGTLAIGSFGVAGLWILKRKRAGSGGAGF